MLKLEYLNTRRKMKIKSLKQMEEIVTKNSSLFWDGWTVVSKQKSDNKLCLECPVAKTCFAVGVSSKEWGVWGGIYLESGSISKEFNSHKTKDIWGSIWQKMSFE